MKFFVNEKLILLLLYQIYENIFEKEKYIKSRILICRDGEFNDDEIVDIKLEEFLIIVENINWKSFYKFFNFFLLMSKFLLK